MIGFDFVCKLRQVFGRDLVITCHRKEELNGVPGLQRLLIFLIILSIGIVVSVAGFNAIYIIKIAQFTNAIVLPFVAMFLVKSMNNKSIPKAYRNDAIQNILAVAVLLFTFVLGVKTLSSLFGLI